MKVMLLLAGVLSLPQVHSQSIKALPLPVTLGLTAYHKRFQDPLALQFNLASLSRIEEPIAAVASELRFLLEGLKYSYGAVAFPLQGGGLGVSVAHFGLEGFSQSKLGLAFSRKLGQQSGLGIQINYHRITARGYGNANAISAGVGAQFRLTEKSIFGIQIENPFSTRIGDSQEKLASVYSVGLSNQVSEQVYLSGIFLKQENSPPQLIIHINYSVTQPLSLTTGCSITTSEAFAGCFVTFRNLQVKQLTSWNQGAGLSAVLAILFHLKKDK